MITAMYLGSVIGTATKDEIAFSNLKPGTFMQGFHASMTVGVIFSVVSLVLSALVREQKIESQTEPE